MHMCGWQGIYLCACCSLPPVICTYQMGGRESKPRESECMVGLSGWSVQVGAELSKWVESVGVGRGFRVRVDEC